MRNFRNLILAVTALALMMSVAAFAREKNHHNVVIPQVVQVGSSRLAPGEYTMEWNEKGSTAEVNFLQRGKSMAQASAKIVNLGHPAASDSVIIKAEVGNAEDLEQIEFSGKKEAFSFKEIPQGE